ncbi:aminoacyl-tRNA hydrolase [Candidatus Saccharibacteria bacterium]|nr:aminoacyl-tRNA hydrolase [Candidatus Saccharibacteria bacterium]
MKLIVGLGNPGAEYLWTRHNLGFIALDFLAITQSTEWADKPKWNAQIAEAEISGEKVFLLKPQAFYNKSGEVAQAVAHFYKIAKEDILVVCDDFTLPYGDVRFREGGSGGGNNGLSSIIDHFGDKVKRIRIGTGSDMRQTMGDADFVLSRLTDDEKSELPNILPVIVSKIKEHL